jgi:hypothetical protein
MSHRKTHPADVTAARCVPDVDQAMSLSFPAHWGIGIEKSGEVKEESTRLIERSFPTSMTRLRFLSRVSEQTAGERRGS